MWAREQYRQFTLYMSIISQSQVHCIRVGHNFNEKPAGTFLVILPTESVLALVNARL
jgi:hypothetical protein